MRANRTYDRSHVSSSKRLPPPMTRALESAAATSYPSSLPTAPRDGPDCERPKSALEAEAREAQVAHAARLQARADLEVQRGRKLRGRKPIVPLAVVDQGARANITDPDLPAGPQPARVPAGLQRPSRLHPDAGDHRCGALDRLARRAAARADDPRRLRRARRRRGSTHRPTSCSPMAATGTSRRSRRSCRMAAR